MAKLADTYKIVAARSQVEQDRVNYHEAGHALIARHFGLGFNYITNLPKNETNSAGRMDVVGHDLNYDKVDEIFMFLMGGMAATHVALDHYDARELESDFQQSWDFFYKLWNSMDIDQNPEDVGAELIYGAIDDAIDITSQKLWHLHQIAAALKDRNTLTMAEIDQILETREPPMALTSDMMVG